MSYEHQNSYISGYLNDKNRRPRVASHFRMRLTSRHRPRDFGGLGSSELIARLGGWHLDGAGRADLIPGINRAPGARGFPGLRSAIRHFLMELELDCTWPSRRLALAMYVPRFRSSKRRKRWFVGLGGCVANQTAAGRLLSHSYKQLVPVVNSPAWKERKKEPRVAWCGRVAASSAASQPSPHATQPALR